MLSEKRIGRITGSRIGAVLELEGAFLSRNQLLKEMVLEKLGYPTYKDSVDLQRGRALEPLILDKLEQDLNIKIDAGEFYISRDYDFLGATPDGMYQKENGEWACVEVKAPRKLKEISASYYAQMQLQMFCTNTKSCLFAQGFSDSSGRLSNLVYSEVEYDAGFIRANLPKLEAFMQDFKENLEKSNDFILQLKAQEYKELNDSIEALNKRKESLKAELIETYGETQNDFIQIYKKTRKGSVDYKRWVQDMQFEIPHSYEKEDTTYYEVRVKL